MKTSSGTAGVLAAKDAKCVFLAGFVDASATVRAVVERMPGRVTLVCMGWEGKEEAEEDRLCAEYLKGLLRGDAPDYGAIKERLRHAETSQRFFSGNPDWPEEDFYCALDLDRFGYALKAVKKGYGVVLVKA